MVHHEQAIQVQADRQRVLESVYAAHPERFMRGPFSAPTIPEPVWISKPKIEDLAQQILP